MGPSRLKFVLKTDVVIEKRHGDMGLVYVPHMFLVPVFVFVFSSSNLE